MTNSDSSRSPFSTFSKFFEDFFSKDLPEWTTQAFANFGLYIPAANIRETPADFQFEMTAPGREKADFKIQFNDGELTVEIAEKPQAELQEGEKFMRKEFGYPPFKRHFPFPKFAVEESKIKANYEQGMLRIRLPKVKKTESGTTQQIKVD